MNRNTIRVSICILIAAICCNISLFGQATNKSQYASNLSNKESIYKNSDGTFFRAKGPNGNYGVVNEENKIIVPFKYEWINVLIHKSGYGFVSGRYPWAENPRRPVGEDIYYADGTKFVNTSKNIQYAKVSNSCPGIHFSRYKEGDETYGLMDINGTILMENAIDIKQIPLGEELHMLFRKLPPDSREDEIYKGISFLDAGNKSGRDMFYISNGVGINNNFSGFRFMGRTDGSIYLQNISDTGNVDQRLRGKAIILTKMIRTDANDNPLSDMTYEIRFAFLKSSNSKGANLFTVYVEDGNYNPVIKTPKNEIFGVEANTFIKHYTYSPNKINGLDVPESFHLAECPSEGLQCPIGIDIENNIKRNDFRIVLTCGAEKYYFSPLRPESLLNTLIESDYNYSNLSWVWLRDFIRFFKEWDNSTPSFGLG